MSEAIGQALDANPNLNAAAARLEAAWAQARMAGAEQLPQIALSSGLSMSQMNMAQFGVSLPNMPTKFDSQRHNLTLGAQWEIDMWSRVRSGKRAARSGALGQAADFAGARHSLAGQVAKAWMLVIEARQQERLASFTVTTYETTVERIRARFEQGVRSSLTCAWPRPASPEPKPTSQNGSLPRTGQHANWRCCLAASRQTN